MNIIKNFGYNYASPAWNKPAAASRQVRFRNREDDTVSLRVFLKRKKNVTQSSNAG